jgi:SAM-dependent methyltransferase
VKRRRKGFPVPDSPEPSAQVEGLSDHDRNLLLERYGERFRDFGYSPKSLWWDKGKQGIRFRVLTSHYDFRNKRVLDIGCGFGDLNNTLRKRSANKYDYYGLDLVQEFVEVARGLYGTPRVRFACGDFLSVAFEEEFDYAIASGIFNFKLSGEDNYDVIDSAIRKALSVCRDGLAFDFLSDKVDFRHAHTFHSSPERVLSIGYKYSRNVLLRNDYMPFEFSLFVFKDASFAVEDTLFTRYKLTDEYAAATGDLNKVKRSAKTGSKAR